jgi:hypothetical protein
MKTHDVPRTEWPEFLARFNREHRAWLATIHGMEHGLPLTRVPSVPIKAVTLVSERPDDTLRLTLGNGISLCAPRPRALRVQEAEEGIERALEIETVDGALIRIAFRAVARPDELDGLAPGETTEEFSAPITSEPRMLTARARKNRQRRGSRTSRSLAPCVENRPEVDVRRNQADVTVPFEDAHHAPRDAPRHVARLFHRRDKMIVLGGEK